MIKLGAVGKVTKTLQVTEAARDGGRRQQKQGCFFAGTDGFGLRGRCGGGRLPPLRGEFLCYFLSSLKESRFKMPNRSRRIHIYHEDKTDA